VQHHALRAVQDEAAVVRPPRRRRHVVQVVARLALEVGEGQRERPVGDLGDQPRALRLAPAQAQEAAAEHDGREVGLDDEPAPERLHHDHHLDGPGAEAAVALLEGQAQEPELGVGGPQPVAEAPRPALVLLALLEVPVGVVDDPVDALLQEPLLLRQVEVHRPLP
jgi:hypothetical protein